MRSLASIRRAAPSLASVLLATASQVALAQGFDKINTTVTNINTILVTISIAVVTIAIIWAGFKMIFQGARLADVANVLIGGTIRNDVGTSTFDVTGSLLQAGGSLQGKDLVLNASAGIGSASDALKLIDSRVTGASVSASSQGNSSRNPHTPLKPPLHNNIAPATNHVIHAANPAACGQSSHADGNSGRASTLIQCGFGSSHTRR